MNSRKNSGAPGRLPNLAGDNILEVLCGNHAGHPFVGEKPRIWWDGGWPAWVCWLDNHPGYPDVDVVGFGDTPLAAYQDWCLGMLTYEAQKQGLYREAQ